MSLTSIKINDTQITSVDNEPCEQSNNLISSDGVFSNTLKTTTTNELQSDLNLSDQNGNILVKFEDGHIKTKNFDSSNEIKTIQLTSPVDLYLSDQNGNVVAKFEDGHIKTKNFDSANTNVQGAVITKQSSSPADLYLSDQTGNVVAKFEDGHIKTKYFNSSNIKQTQIVKTNTLYKTNQFTDFTGTGWSYSNKAITNSSFGYNNKLELTRDFNIQRRATFIDFKTTSTAVVYLGYRDVYRSGFKGGSLISVDFSQNKLNIHSKITDEKTSVLDSISFNTTFNANHFYRLLLRR